VGAVEPKTKPKKKTKINQMSVSLSSTKFTENCTLSYISLQDDEKNPENIA
jgi:hypothetical protein